MGKQLEGFPKEANRSFNLDGTYLAVVQVSEVKKTLCMWGLRKWLNLLHALLGKRIGKMTRKSKDCWKKVRADCDFPYRYWSRTWTNPHFHLKGWRVLSVTNMFHSRGEDTYVLLIQWLDSLSSSRTTTIRKVVRTVRRIQVRQDPEVYSGEVDLGEVDSGRLKWGRFGWCRTLRRILGSDGKRWRSKEHIWLLAGWLILTKPLSWKGECL